MRSRLSCILQQCKYYAYNLPRVACAWSNRIPRVSPAPTKSMLLRSRCTSHVRSIDINTMQSTQYLLCRRDYCVNTRHAPNTSTPKRPSSRPAIGNDSRAIGKPRQACLLALPKSMNVGPPPIRELRLSNVHTTNSHTYSSHKREIIPLCRSARILTHVVSALSCTGPTAIIRPACRGRKVVSPDRLSEDGVCY